MPKASIPLTNCAKLEKEIYIDMLTIRFGAYIHINTYTSCAGKFNVIDPWASSP